MSDIHYTAVHFFRSFAHEPARLVPLLACACAVTLVIAIMSDALTKRQSGAESKTGESKI